MTRMIQAVPVITTAVTGIHRWLRKSNALSTDHGALAYADDCMPVNTFPVSIHTDTSISNPNRKSGIPRPTKVTVVRKLSAREYWWVAE